MKIAMLGVKSIPWGGGIPTYTEELGSRLVARGHQVTVYCRGQYLDDPSCSVHRGIERRTSGGLRGKHFDAPSHTLTAACNSMVRDFDILHIHGMAPGFVAPMIRAFSRKRVVLTVHACDWKGNKWGRLARLCMQQASGVGLRMAHRVTTVSHGLQEYLQEERGCDAAYTPPGVPIADIIPAYDILKLGLEPNDYALCVSRLMPEKGIHYVVEAFERLHTDKKLVIAGNCPYECDYVKELMSHAGDRIIFLGYVSGRLLEELYSHASVFLQPSDLEGLPISVVEAMSYGRCVLASDIPQNQECLGGNGFTFEAGNVDDLTEKLSWLLENPSACENQFGRVREYVWHTFNWDRTTDTYERLYAQCLEAPASERAVAEPMH